MANTQWQENQAKLVTADTQVATGECILHTVTISCNDSAPTAGSVIVRDGVAATGPILLNHTFTTTYFQAYTLHFDVKCHNGIYVDFTTTADVNVTITYR